MYIALLIAIPLRNLFYLDTGAKKAFAGLMVALLFSACLKDRLGKFEHLNGIRWKGNYAAPIVNVDLNLQDAVGLVNNDLVNQLPNKAMVIHYDAMHFSMRGDEMYTIDNRLFNSVIVPTSNELNTLNNSGFVSVERNLVFDLNPGSGNQLDSIWLKAGVFGANLSVNTSHQGKVSIQLLDLNNGNNEISFTHNWTTPGFIYRSRTHNINGLESLDLSKASPGYNRFRVKIVWEITKSGIVGNNDQLEFNISTEGLKFRKLHGYLNQPNLFAVQDSIDLTIFSNEILKGNIVFEDARVKLLFDNSMGLASQYQISQLALIDKSGVPTALNGYNATGNIASAPSSASETSISDSIYLTKAGGSNVATVMKSEPYYLSYSVNATTSASKGFIWDNSQLGLTVTVELPMTVSTKDLVLEDTSKMDLGLGSEAEFVEMIKFKFYTENGLPLGVGLQAYFMDDKFNTLDSLFQPFRYLLKQANVDAAGAVISPSIEQWELVLNKPKIMNIIHAKHVRIRAWIPTSTYSGNSVPVLITADDKLKFKMGVEVKLSADAEL